MSNIKLKEFPLLYSDRLTFTPITVVDNEDVFLIFSDPLVVKYYNIKKIETEDQAKQIIDYFHMRWQEKIGVRWAIRLNGRLIGTIGFHNFTSESVEIGYELNSEFWNNGYMKETLETILHFGFNTLMIQTVIGKVDVDNVSSIKSLKRCGFNSTNVITELKTDDFHLHLDTLKLNSEDFLIKM